MLVAVGNLSWERLIEVERLPKPNQDVFTKKTKRMPGGAAANVACTLGLLGNSVGILAAIGRDKDGEELVRDIEAYKVNADFLLRLDRETSEFVVVMDSLGNRSFFLNPEGAAFHLSIDRFPHRLLASPIGSLAFVGCKLDLAAELIRQAGSSDRQLFANIGFWIAAGALGQSSLDVLNRLTCLFLNRSEYEMLDGALKTDLTSMSFLQENRKQLIITDGANPTVVASTEGWIMVEAEPLEGIVNTLGCGDAFMGGYLSQFLRGGSPVDCCRVGHLCARRIACLEEERSADLVLNPLP
jgi:sugar/nucleoside kinase (ribokinase family)